MATAENATVPVATFPPFDPATFPSQLFWFVVAFGVLYLCMQFLIAPRLTYISQTRHEKREGDLKAAAKAREQAEAASVAYETALSQAKISAQAMGQKARDEAAAKTEARRKKIDADMSKRLQEAEVSIASRKGVAMANVNSIAIDAARSVLTHITSDVSKLISDDDLNNALKASNSI